MDNLIYEKVFMHERVSRLSVSQQSEYAKTFQEILIEIVKERPDATIQSLLNPTADDE